MYEDEEYREDQEDAKKLWRNNNSDYWKKYRKKNTKYTENNREKQKQRNRSLRNRKSSSEVIANMGVLDEGNEGLAGLYRIIPLSDKVAKMTALTVRIEVISGD